MHLAQYYYSPQHKKEDSKSSISKTHGKAKRKARNGRRMTVIKGTEAWILTGCSIGEKEELLLEVAYRRDVALDGG